MTAKCPQRSCSVLVAVLALATAFSLSPLAFAQNQGMGVGNKSPSQSQQSNETNSYTLSQDSYDQITRAQKLMGNGDYAKARSVAEALLPRASKESRYADALTNEIIAQTYLLQKNYDGAEPYLEKIVQLDALQPQDQQSVVYELATIYLGQSKYDDSIRLYKEVLAQDEQKKQTPPPDLYYHLGLAYSLKGDYQQAYNYIGEAIQQSDKKVEDWYQNWFITAYKLKNYQKANDIAKELVVNWPGKRDYWTYLSNTYLLLHQDREAAAVYGLMYQQGLLKNKDDYLQLASLYLEANAPYKAAQVLKAGLDKGIIPKTVDNYETLANAWIQSRSWDKALDTLGQEAALSSTGDVYLRQAAIYLNNQDYPKAEQAAQNALNKGGLKDPGEAWMLMGQSAFGQKDWDTALNAFHKAENYKDQAKAAQSWVQYVNLTRTGGSPGSGGH